MLLKAMISYEKRIDIVVSGALTIRRLLRDNVERRIASVLAPRSRRSAIVIAIVISQCRILIFLSSRLIIPGNVR